MIIKTISCSMTRQVQAYQPATFSMQAELADGEDPQAAAKELQRLVIKVLYKDSQILRDELISKLVDCVTPSKTSNTKAIVTTPQTPNF